jgi:GNAT superfamily N-acetyltransferase
VEFALEISTERSGMSDEIVVRKASPADGRDIANMFHRYLNWITINHDPGEIFHRVIPEEDFVSTVKTSPAVVALDGEQVAGFAITRPSEPFLLDIRNIFVDDPYRDRGIGTMLLRELENIAGEIGTRVMIATSSRMWHPGKYHPTSLFERAGYTTLDLDDGLQFYYRALPDRPKIDVSKGAAAVTGIQRYSFHR